MHFRSSGVTTVVKKKRTENPFLPTFSVTNNFESGEVLHKPLSDKSMDESLCTTLYEKLTNDLAFTFTTALFTSIRCEDC